jgi:hypothetical protein
MRRVLSCIFRYAITPAETDPARDIGFEPPVAVLDKVTASRTAAPMPNPTNHRNSRL